MYSLVDVVFKQRNVQFGVQILAGKRIILSKWPNWLWVPPCLLFRRYWEYLPARKTSGEWSWLLSSTYSRSSNEWSYTIIPPIRLHVV